MEIFALYIWMKLPVITEIIATLSGGFAWAFGILTTIAAAYWMIERISFGDNQTSLSRAASKDDRDAHKALEKEKLAEYKERVKWAKRWFVVFILMWFGALSTIQLSKMIPTQKETAALAAAYAAKVVIESESGQKIMNKLKAKIDELAQ